MGMSLGCCAPIISMAFIYSIGWTGIPSNDPLQSEDFLFSSLPFQEEKKKKQQFCPFCGMATHRRRSNYS